MGAGVVKCTLHAHILDTQTERWKVIVMKALGLMVSLVVLAGPAAANYGDIDTELAELLPTKVSVAQPLQTPSNVVASADTCALPSDHLVSVPDSFSVSGATEMACLTE